MDNNCLSDTPSTIDRCESSGNCEKDIKIGDKESETKTKDSLKEYEVKNIYITTPL